MFKSFFLSRHFALWGWPGAALIFIGTWYQVQIDVAINEWFGGFYDLVQKALGSPGAITLSEFFGFLMSFLGLTGHNAAVFVGDGLYSYLLLFLNVWSF